MLNMNSLIILLVEEYDAVKTVFKAYLYYTLFSLYI